MRMEEETYLVKVLVHRLLVVELDSFPYVQYYSIVSPTTQRIQAHCDVNMIGSRGFLASARWSARR